MAADYKETAEQKLLKMIETSSGDEVSKGKAKKAAAGTGGTTSFLKTLNILFILGIIAAGAYLSQEIKSGNDLMAQEIEVPSLGSMAHSRNKDALLPTVQRLSYYTTPLSRRNLFEPYVPKAQQIVEVTETNKALASKTSHLKLVGIAWMDTVDSASVMLEDTSQDVTYFLKSNEKVGDINIKTIYADSVELGFQDEEIMIRYDTPQP